MRAAVYTEYGPPEVVRLAEVPRPSPRGDEVLVRVHATTVTAADWRVRSLTVPRGFGLLSRLALGVRRPRKPVLGVELAGVVEAVGPGSRRFRAGDAVFAFVGAGFGCHAEYRCVSERAAIAPMPPGLSFEEAAALSFGGATALDFFRRGALKAGERVLVNGASGAVGSAAVQLARHLGARVTAVCGPTNVAWVRALGAERVLDYTREDFTQDGARYDVLLDAAGTAPYARARHALAEGGRLLAVYGHLPDLLRGGWVALTTRHRIVAAPAGERAEDLALLAQLAAEGRYRPVIDRRYPLEDIVEAHRYVDTGRKKGNVSIQVRAG